MTEKHKWHKEIIAFANGEEVMGRRGSSGAWQVMLPVDFRHFDDLDCQFRIVPKPININGFEISEPLREEPENGTDYFYSCPSIPALFGMSRWGRDEYRFNHLKIGFVHLTAEAAIKHAEALLSFTQSEAEQ